MDAPPAPETDTDDLASARVDLDPNEASGLAAVTDEGLLERLGWARGFFTVLDDGPVTRCVALLGQPLERDEDGEGWEIRRIRATVEGKAPTTEDSESVSVLGPDVWVYGSQFGSKQGPLQRKRHYVARFRQDEVRLDGDRARVPMRVVATDFRLHRLVNDALRFSNVDVLPLGPRTREDIVHATRLRAIRKERAWAHRIRFDDHPINVEGTAHRPDGTVLIGLRFPVTGDGHPLLVGVRGLDRWFDEDGSEPEAVGVWTVTNLGSRGEHVGIRDLLDEGEDVHMLVGNMEAAGEGSTMLEEHPEGATAYSTHWVATFPTDQDWGEVEARFVRGFGELRRVEGLARGSDGRFVYVSDEDDGVHTRIERSR